MNRILILVAVLFFASYLFAWGKHDLDVYAEPYSHGPALHRTGEVWQFSNTLEIFDATSAHGSVELYINATGELSIGGSVEIKGDFRVGGAFAVGTVGVSLTTLETQHIQHPTGGTISIADAVEMRDGLVVIGSITGETALYVSTETTLNGSQDTDGDFQWNSIYLAPGVHFDADAGAVGIGGSANAAYSLEVTGTAKVSSNLYAPSIEDPNDTVFNINDSTYLTGSMEITAGLIVDTNTLHVNGTTNKVGIGTANPGYKLTVAGTAATDANTTVTNSHTALASMYFRARGDSAGIGGQSYANQIISNNGTNVDLEIYTIGAAGNSVVIGTNSTERMRIATDGKVGIGTAAPVAKLDILDGNLSLADTDVVHGMTTFVPTNTFGYMTPDSATGGGLQLWGVTDANDAYGVKILGVNGGANPSVAAVTLSGSKKSGATMQAMVASEEVLVVDNWGTKLITVKGDGKVGIGTAEPSVTLDVFGTVEAYDFVNVSDERLKKNIKTLEGNSSEKIKALRVASWDWKSEQHGGSIGLVAQEVEQVIPEAVATYPAVCDSEENEIKPEHKAIRLKALIAHLIKSNQEQQARIEQLTKAVAALAK